MSAPLEPFASPRQRLSLASAPLPRRVREPLQDLLALVSDAVIARLEAALTELEQLLARRAENAAGSPSHAHHLENLRAVQRNRDRLAPRFIAALEDAFARVRMPAPEAPAAAAPVRVPVHELRLLEDDEASEDALLRRITMRYESRASLPLQLLGQRFGVLAGQPAFDPQRLPVGPYRLASLLGEASDVLEIGADARLELIALFDRVVLVDFEPLADTMNTMLAEHGVLPSLMFVPLRMQPRARNGGGVAAAAATVPASSAGTGWGETAGSFDFVQQLLERRRGLLDRLRAGAQPASAAAPVLSTDELVAALAALQAQPAANPAQLRAALRDRPGPDPSRDVLPEDADIFELLGLFYTQLRREMRAGSPGATLLDRLLVTMLRVALRDHRFFEYPQHPARQLLATVAESGVRWLAEDELDPQLQATLQRAVDEVIERYDGDVRVFETANHAIAEQQQAAARKAEVSERRQVDAARGKEKLATARQRAADVIAAETDGRELPRLTCTLLSQAWADVLTLTLLRHDEGSDEWARQLAMTREIVSALGGAAPAEGLERRVCEALTTVGYHPDEASMLARWLSAQGGADDDSLASRTELAMRLRARTRLGEQTVADAPLPLPLTAEEKLQLDALRTTPAGRWFDFATGPDAVVRRRLAWLGPTTNLALFVNRRGQRIEEITLDRLARLITAGQVRPVDADDRRNVAERAWDATLTALRRFGGAEPTGDEEHA